RPRHRRDGVRPRDARRRRRGWNRGAALLDRPRRARRGRAAAARALSRPARRPGIAPRPGADRRLDGGTHVKRGFDVRAAMPPIAITAAALVASSAVLLAAGANPLVALDALARGAFGDGFAIADTLLKTCPLVLTGLAV